MANKENVVGIRKNSKDDMQKVMNFIVIGLGSMGKRRVRCLKTLGVPDENIHGFDMRKDRCHESNQKYGIKTFSDFDKIDLHHYNAYIISTPPDAHTQYCKYAIDNNKPAFIEGSVLLEEVMEAQDYNKAKNVFLAPSCTLRFHPVIKNIKEIIDSGKYGKVTNFTYHFGQYLPTWHPWDNFNDFYASKRKTGGAREMVAFELTWMVDVIGRPLDIKGYFQKTMNMGVQLEDTYSFLLKYGDKLGTVTADVVSRYAIRNLVINMENAQIQWRWDDNFFKLYEAGNNRWITYSQPENIAESGYNKNIIEGMYVDELQSFINGIYDHKAYPNTIEDDIYVLELLNKIEETDGGF